MFSRLPPATLSFFFFNDTATTEIYTLSLHDALPIFISRKRQELLGPKLIRQSYALGALDKGVQAKLKELRQTGFVRRLWAKEDRKSTRLNSSHLVISYAVFCLKKKKRKEQQQQ